MRNAALLCIVASSFACGGNSTPPPQPPPAGTVDVSNTPASAPIAIVPAGPQTPIERLKSYAVRRGADAALVLDAEKLRASLGGELIAPLVAFGNELFAKACDFPPLDDIALAAGSFFGGRPERVYIALETKHPAQDWVACATRYAGRRGHTRKPESDEVNVMLFNGLRIEAVAAHVLVMSPEAEGPLQAVAGGGGMLASSLDLGGDHFFEVRGDVPMDDQRVRNIRFDIGGDKSTVSAHLVFDLPNGKGNEVSELFNQGRERARAKNAPPFLPWLFEKLHYDLQGDHFEANIALERADISKVAGVAQLLFGTSSGRTPSGPSEARSGVHQIARHAMMWFELEVADPKNPSRTTHRTTCPPSAPLTPAKVPKGVAYQSSATDWSKPAWAGLRFVMSDPQRYSYGIDTARDGKSCKFYAVGDLNGDGKTSRFELEAKVKPATSPGSGPSLWIAPSIIETRPDE